MANVDWYIEGLEFGNCNCDYGCPCQFEALPTHGDCRGFGVIRIDRGHFGEVKLDGLNVAPMYAWMTIKLSMSTMKPTSAPIRGERSVLPTLINLGLAVKGPNGYSRWPEPAVIRGMPVLAA